MADGAGSSPAPLRALRFDADARVLYALDQTALPFSERELALRSAAEVAAAIKRLAIRGAPLIGVAAAYGVALEVAAEPTPVALKRACAILIASRPTAVNLAWAVERMGRAGAEGALAQARAIDAEEQAASAAMAAHGADYLAGTRRILTHCNTGALAAPGRGTALGVIAELHDRGELELVIATESRPLLQGARLTVYEMGKLGIRHRLIVDAAAAGLLAAGAAQAVILGADRIAANGDVANKVGTYALALAARAAQIPFVVAAPSSTIDPDTATGADIPIEQRGDDEVRHALGQPLTVAGTATLNPAFDVTPAALVTAIVTEHGVISPVNAAGLARAIA